MVFFLFSVTICQAWHYLQLKGVRLDQETIRVIFEQEIMKMAKPKEYMGMWEMMALSSALQVPLYSVYPNLGNPVVRSDLNRKVEPRLSTVGVCSKTGSPV